MYTFKTTKDIALDISQKIKTVRIGLNFTQEEFALKSGVTLSTYRTFEKSGKGSFETFIMIVTGLGRINELSRILVSSDFSPIQALKEKEKPKRQRVRNGYKADIEKAPSIIKSDESFIQMIKDTNAKRTK